MKPRINLCETTLEDGSTFSLHEHDGRHYLAHDGTQTSGPVTRIAETELGAMACSPFRPVRQPHVWIAGLGLGFILEGARSTLLQKRAVFHIAEPTAELPGWLRQHLDDASFLDDPRVIIHPSLDLAPCKESGLHAMLIHADTAPDTDPKRPFFEDRSWLRRAFDMLKEGGILAVASSRPPRHFERTLERCGFITACHEINVSPKSAKPRIHQLILGRKDHS